MINVGLSRFLRWGTHKIGEWTLVSLFLLMVIFACAVIILSDLVNGFQPGLQVMITFVGLCVGWLFAKSHVSEKRAFFWLLLVGILFVSFNVEVSFSLLWSLIKTTVHVLGEILTWIPGDVLPNTSGFILLSQTVAERMTIAPAHFFMWFRSSLGTWLGNDQGDVFLVYPEYNNLVWGLILWFVAVWASWAIRRREQPLEANLPAGVLLAASLSFSRANALWLIPLLAGVMILMSLTHYFKKESQWKASGIDYAEDIRFDLGIWIILLVIGIVGTSSLVSMFSPQKTIKALQNFVQNRSQTTEQIGQSLGLQTYPNPSGVSNVIYTGELPRQHLLGTGPELSQNRVMTVKVTSPDYIPPQANGGRTVPRYYWRALVYDVYTGHGWGTSRTSLEEYSANKIITSSIQPGTSVIYLQIQAATNLDRWLYYTGNLVSADQDYQVEWRLPSEARRDTFGARFVENVPSFTVTSSIFRTGMNQLRSAGENYPEWVRERYLGFPDTVPDRVIELAHSITDQANSPFDKAIALEAYVHAITYTLDVPVPPHDQDAADYFLFYLKKGFCGYAATSMAVMARAVGLPARLVMGYTSGAYDEQSSLYLVTEADAHAWVEIYFPDIGWVEFEPTGGIAEIDRPEDVPGFGDILSGSTKPKSHENPLTRWAQWLVWTGYLLGFIALLIAAWLLTEALRLRYLPPETAMVRIYRDIFQKSMHLRISLQPGFTPYEVSASLIQKVSSIPQSNTMNKLLKHIPQKIGMLVDLYTSAIYSTHPLDRSRQSKAIRTWQSLRLQLWVAGWIIRR